MFYLLLLSGVVTNVHGSGRPESGSEHIFSKSIEGSITVPHGISVALGIKIMSRLQDNESEEVENVIESLGLLSMKDTYQVTREDVAQTLLNMIPHPKRHTSVNRKKDDLGNREYVEDLVNTVMR